MKNSCVIVFLFFSISLFSQTVYKTPSGQKYHTSTCRYVKNVSNSLSLTEAKSNGLSACSQCNPNQIQNRNALNLGIKPSEAKGVTFEAKQCKGKTKTGLRCKRRTKNKNGYCFQHES